MTMHLMSLDRYAVGWFWWHTALTYQPKILYCSLVQNFAVWKQSAVPSKLHIRICLARCFRCGKLRYLKMQSCTVSNRSLRDCAIHHSLLVEKEDIGWVDHVNVVQYRLPVSFYYNHFCVLQKWGIEPLFGTKLDNQISLIKSQLILHR